jgi:hypothetical protein
VLSCIHERCSSEDGKLAKRDRKLRDFQRVPHTTLDHFKQIENVHRETCRNPKHATGNEPPLTPEP